MARSPQNPPGADDGAHSSRPRTSGRGSQDPLVTRRDMAGWVGGSPRPNAAGRWPGERLGLAQHGPTSMAGWGRRILAVVIDWSIALLISNLWFEGHPLVTLGFYILMQVVLLGLLGTTVGKRIAGIQVVRVGGAMAGPVRVLIRTALWCLVVTPFMVDPDGRGVHDRVAGTVQIRM
ncbi:RDD family protein [Citricoccus nitrophenolicus]|uniref:RDD family protein n=1 Tax=Citricoccus nitrophenolicus TaxID=863575 RepID=UPI0031EA0EA2